MRQGEFPQGLSGCARVSAEFALSPCSPKPEVRGSEKLQEDVEEWEELRVILCPASACHYTAADLCLRKRSYGALRVSE
jgi:hypothetical protein